MMDEQLVFLTRAVGVAIVGVSIGMWTVVFVACVRRIRAGGNGAAHACVWASSTILFTNVVAAISRVDRIRVEAPLVLIDTLGLLAVLVSIVAALSALKALNRGHI